MERAQMSMDGFHGWEVMAPLKDGQNTQHHVSTETGFHGWEVMAPLKGRSCRRWTNRVEEFPWLGGHGSIEGARTRRPHGRGPGVSMAGRSWLH